MESIPYHSIRGLNFGIYEKENLNSLSVLEVTNLQTFDALGHPSSNGLYDPALGPSERDEPCATCGLNQRACPGHIGYINLPLPVFNPMFFRNLYQLLKGSCFTCNRLLAPPSSSFLLLAQLQVLNYGLVGAVEDLEELMAEAATKKAKNAMELTAELKARLESYVQESLLVAKEEANVYSSRSVVECRNRITKRFLQEHLMKAGRKCLHCGDSKKPLAVYQNVRFVFAASSSKPGQLLDDMQNDSLSSSKVGNQSYITPLDARKYIEELWKNEKLLLQEIFGILKDTSPTEVFFLETIIVPPSRFRPISFMKGRKYENSQTNALNQLMTAAAAVSDIIKLIKGPEQEFLEKAIDGKMATKFNFLWTKLQLAVNCYYDSDLDKLHPVKMPGVKQILEKKEGLFRKNMMGKRVNYASRSVISPDPYIMVDEVGIPQVFATRLTFPQPVTPWNVQELRRSVKNGPNVHPGAVLVEDEEGVVTRLLPHNFLQREAIAKQLLTPGAVPGKCKIVHRHIKSGDMVLMNRQPTLHRPSIMAHKVRVLSGEKTLRLHYSNCKSYNADFDGDEMNCHLPQSELARAEAFCLANVGNHYLVPKDGTPLGGLIQDHVISGAILTMRGQFFSREEYQRLVYGSLTFSTKSICLLSPCILRPFCLWSGKQVLSTIILNLIPEGKPLVCLEGTAKIDGKHFINGVPNSSSTTLSEKDMCESQVIFRHGELLCGVLDKAHFGPTPHGLIHYCYELYGGATCSILLTSFARLFTHFLQLHRGFTLGIEDILVTEKANRRRKRILVELPALGMEACCNALGLRLNDPGLNVKMREAHCSRDDRLLKQLDAAMKQYTDSINNKINKICMPKGLWKSFPANNLQLMVQSGAKGATVNCMQISCLLGQIELEGRRVPLMLSGKTLPSFYTYDTSPRAGGFVSGRFLTGIRPQEFFFHCMAGREGLIDTAVKTSRSGYLQRCLVKHLEGLVVNYDLTVRDSDGSLIQFYYGEDGLDVGKRQLLTTKQFPFVLANHEAVISSHELDELEDRLNSRRVRSVKRKLMKWNLKYGQHISKKRDSAFLHFSDANFGAVLAACPDVKEAKAVLQDMWFNLKPHQRKRFTRLTKRRPDPLFSELRPDLYLGAVSEHMDKLLDDYYESNSETPDYLRRVVHYQALRAVCQPGESVGLLAAQSLGEPSTQMTLNTFHFAGRGEMNMTLGIPRLREILMTASSKIGTPSMDLPLLPSANPEKLRRKLTAVFLSEVLQEVQVEESLVIRGDRRFRKYKLKFVFLPHKAYKRQFCVRPAYILQFMEQNFLRKLCVAIRKKLAMLPSSRSLRASNKSRASEEPEEMAPPPEEADNSSEEEEDEGDTTSAGQKRKHDQEQEYEAPEDVEQIPEEDAFGEEGEEKQPQADSEEEQLEGSFSIVDHNDQRVGAVVASHEWISEYKYDSLKSSWCHVTLQLPLVGSKLDIASIVESEARKTLLSQTSGIRRAFVVKDSQGQPMVKTEGVNFLEIFALRDVVDLNRLYSNDIHNIARTYGIEAAARAIVREVADVFAAYGIRVDPRHLLLVADYMTFDGTFRGCNRMAMEANASPLQQMTFETTLNFLRSATLFGTKEELRSASARIVAGEVVTGGTGAFDLFLKRPV